MKFDLLIQGARLFDGSGERPFQADLGVFEGRIAQIGDLRGASAERALDAEGLSLAPGFIDIHTHSDESLLVNPRAESKIHQGVTTEVLGNCGCSPAPLEGQLLAETRKELREEYDLEVTWRTVGGYLSALEKQGVAVNCLTLVGNGNLRACTIGYESRKASSEESGRMQELLRNSLAEGAWGLSSGLIYVPSIFSDTEELVSFGKVVADFGGLYTTHMRSEGDELLEAIKEAARIGEEAGIRVEISHLKASGQRNWGKAAEAVALIEELRGRGMRIGCDQYPYRASSTGLDKILPVWALEGGEAEVLARLGDLESHARILREVENHPQKDWRKVILATIPLSRYASWQGKTIAEIAERERREPARLVLDLIAEAGLRIGAIFFSMDEADVETILRYPGTAIGSDAAARSPQGPLGRGKPHPRSYGTFPRVLGYYAREKGLFPLQEAVRRMTSLPAGRLHLPGRGLLKEGYWADLVLFDAERIRDEATFEDPHRFPAGIEYVVVNGRIVVEKGWHTGILAGRILRKGER